MLTLLLVGMLILTFNVQPVEIDPNTIYVDDDNTGGPWDGTPEYPYQNITSAIEHASVNDTIYVYNGTYYENVVLNKSVSLIGENRNAAILDGDLSTGFHVISDNVNISGFTIRNCKPPMGGVGGGIRLDSCGNCKISGNKIDNNRMGIWLDRGSSHFIFNNTFSSCVYAIGGSYTDSGNNLSIFNNFISASTYCIYLLRSSNSIVSNNTIVNGGLSIYLQFCSNTILTNNNMTNIQSLLVKGVSLSDFIHDIDVSNTVDGKPVYYLINQSNLIIDPSTFPNIGYLGLVDSTNITIRNLNLTGSRQGLLLAYTTNSTMTRLNISFNANGIWTSNSSNNTITDNEITLNGNGISLNHFSSNNTISNNTISNSGVDAIFLGQSDRNIIKYNNLSNNARGISWFNSQDNTIYHNNLVENTEQVFYFPLANIWDDGYPSGGNYWSDYTGFDELSGPNQDQLGSDGIGDTPYVVDAEDPTLKRLLLLPTLTRQQSPHSQTSP